MTDDSLRSTVTDVIRALNEAGYASEPDPGNNVANAPAYLKVFCKGVSKDNRVDYLNLVFGGTAGEQVTIEGEQTSFPIPAEMRDLVERIRYKLPCP
jgi:hypothetical protein